MSSSDVVEDEAAHTRPKRVTTPRRSPAVRRPANATPTRKMAADKAGTPNSAPARIKPSTKKAEPTLFTDFLLGRPSVSRARRKSLDAVPMEMKRSAVGKVQPPGGVKERVKKWQKASAAAAIEDNLEPPSEPDDMSLHLEDESVTERDRRRIKFRKHHTQRPGRRKSGDKDNPTPYLRSVSSPKKRVVSDDHWVVNRERKSPPRTPKVFDEPLSKGQTLPKDFLKNSINPPLEKKIEDWNKRTISDETVHKDKQTRKVSEAAAKNVEHINVPFEYESSDHGIRARPVKAKLSKDVAIEVPVYSHEKRKDRQQEAETTQAPRRRSEKRSEPSPVAKELPQSRREHAIISNNEGESNDSCRTPTHTPRRKNRLRKSLSSESFADIPVGYSAFSVLDISVGGDAAITRPSKPQRQPSLSAVPKVLKKVYAEGLKKVHGAVDPPRIGVNQPPSIESWLKGTSDPFVDHVPTPESIFEIAKPKTRQRNSEKQTAYQEQNNHEGDGYGVDMADPRNDTMQPSLGSVHETVSNHQAVETLVNSRASSERIINERCMPPLSPTGLKRSPVARHVSSPKTVKRTPSTNIGVDPVKGRPQPVSRGRFPSRSTAVSDSSFEISDSTDGGRLGLKDRDDESGGKTQEYPLPRSLPTLDASYLNSRNVPGLSSYKATGQRARNATEQRHLSTIASVETFKTSPSSMETSSELSDTTVTQTTVTQNTSRTSNTSNSSHTGTDVYDRQNNNSGLKRRLTKHSDLLSVLSLPDASARGRTKSIKSARSIRTTRTRLETATVRDLLQELADDEIKYKRELKTLVDGVIPVLLTCVLSKSDPAIATGMFGQSSSGQADSFITKPIVDMGVALERLKTLHNRIPLDDIDLLLHWALGAHKVYDDYVDAWRMGFQNVIVNLAPATQSNSGEDQSLDEMPRNEDGDVLNENGERVDVAFLLKRPLVRVKYLAKVMKVCMNPKFRKASTYGNTGHLHYQASRASNQSQ